MKINWPWKWEVPPDPVKRCRLYKEQGCAHVDGPLCDFETCTMRLKHELWRLEEELDIPLNLRHYKK